MNPAVHLKVLHRDGGCFAAQMDPKHVCRDQWGITHLPDDDRVLTVDHVKPFLMMGRKFSDEIEFMVAMCHAANVGVPSKALRAKEREYLSGLYPDAWAKVRPVSSSANAPVTEASPEIDGTLGTRSPA
jgi:hypothetical protein